MSNTVSATCPKCRTALRIPAQWAGKAVKCKKCKAVVKVPQAAAQPAPATPQPAPYPAPMPVPQMVYDPATGAYVPAPAAAPPAYPYPPAGYPAPQPGYPYPMPPGYAAPPGYPAPYPYPPPGPQTDFSSMAPQRDGRRKKYKRGGSGIVFVVLGLFGLLVVGGGIGAAVVFKDKLLAFLNSPTQQTTPTTSGPTPPVTAKATNPRRMLALSVTRYLYCNPLTGGKTVGGASEFGEAVKALAFRWEVPDHKDNNQLFAVTDADGKMPAAVAQRPMLKPVIADTVARFCGTSRPQDRILIYFGGHAFAKDGKAYLVPTEGDLNEPDTLLPLTDLWDKLRACPAQQKVVLFDVCRLSTDDNAVRPGSEPMSEELDKLLHSPPDGVQVLTSCSAGQTAGEFRTAPDADTPQGSAFLGALRTVARKTKGTKVNPADPFPVSQWAEATEKRLADVLAKDHPSKPKASGSEPTAVALNPDEPPARGFDIPAPPKGADTKDVKAAFAALETPPLLGPPPVEGDHPEDAVVFSADAMKAYSEQPADDQHPWRAAATKAIADIRGKWKEFADPTKGGVLFDGLSGKANDEIKKAIEKEQKPLSVLALELSEIVDALLEHKENAEKDESAYWRATYRFALAQAKLRLAFSHEANLALGNVRTDNLPEGSDGWKLVQVPKMSNRKEATGAKEAQALLDELAKECKGTPWEVAAKQWRTVSIGLKWQPKKADADTTTTTEEKK